MGQQGSYGSSSPVIGTLWYTFYQKLFHDYTRVTLYRAGQQAVAFCDSDCNQPLHFSPEVRLPRRLSLKQPVGITASPRDPPEC